MNNEYGAPMIVLFNNNEKRYFYFHKNAVVYFYHIDSSGNKMYKLVVSKKDNFAVFYYNEYEWITRIENYMRNVIRTVTIIRPMKSAIIKEYDREGKLIRTREY